MMPKRDYRRYAMMFLFVFLVTVFSVTSSLWILKYSGMPLLQSGAITAETIGLGPVTFLISFLTQAIAFGVLYVLVIAAAKYLEADKKSTDYFIDSLGSASMIFMLGVFLNVVQYLIFASYSIVSLVFIPFFALAYVGVKVLEQQKAGSRAYYFLFALFVLASLSGLITYAYNLYTIISVVHNTLWYLGVLQ
jgi:hypothetical protein